MKMGTPLKSHAGHLQAVFKILDANRDGKIDEKDLKNFFSNILGHETTPADIEKLLRDINGEGSRAVMAAANTKPPPADFPTFMHFVNQRLKLPLQGELGEIFNYLDSDKDGFVTTENICNCAEALSIKICKETAELLVKACGCPTKVNFEEFCKMVAKSLPAVDT